VASRRLLHKNQWNLQVEDRRHMRNLMKQLTLGTALALVGVQAAQASVIIAQSTTGSEVLLSVVNKNTNASVLQDLGVLRDDLTPGDSFTLDAIITDFITAAGGLANVTFAVTGGGALNSTAAGRYLHSSGNNALDTGATTDGPANSIRGAFLSNRQALVTGLNNTNLGDTDTNNNFAYGPFTAGVPNYTANNTFRWGIASGAAATTFNTLGEGLNEIFLYAIQFGSTSTGNGNVIGLNLKALLRFNDPEVGSRLEVTAVPLPASIWLLGTAVAGVIGRRHLKKKALAAT